MMSLEDEDNGHSIRNNIIEKNVRKKWNDLKKQETLSSITL
jgi:hypothetical protein